MAITWTNAALLSIELMGKDFSEILIGILRFSFKKFHLEVLSSKMAVILSRGKWAISAFVCLKWIKTAHTNSLTSAVFEWYIITRFFRLDANHLIVLINTLRPIQNSRHFADNTYKRIFLNETARISIKISLKFVSKGPVNDNSALVRILAGRRPSDKSMSEPMMVRLYAYMRHSASMS